MNTDKLFTDLKTAGSQLNAIKGDLDELWTQARSDLNDKAKVALEEIQKKVNEARNKIAVAEAVVVDRTKEAAEKTDAYVRENPWKSVGVAAAFGLLIGLIASKR